MLGSFEIIVNVSTETVDCYIERQQGKRWMHDDPDAWAEAGKAVRTAQVRLDAFGG